MVVDGLAQDSVQEGGGGGGTTDACAAAHTVYYPGTW